MNVDMKEQNVNGFKYPLCNGDRDNNAVVPGNQKEINF